MRLRVMELPENEVESRLKVLGMHSKVYTGLLKDYTNRLFIGVTEW